MLHKRYFYNLIISDETTLFQIASLELRSYLNLMGNSLTKTQNYYYFVLEIGLF